ncbi:hypothetical protein [Desulfoferula mesophila]|uniref:Uncharacterized protein n=1 Tax=Desulfoferula mesophila TaxID=3058419 RepID=A0AAU9ERY8_9BACT|nr:hypothetical protein FAK_16260 [Desulfoferula mesophilus]
MPPMLVHLVGPGSAAQEEFVGEFCRECQTLGLGVALVRPEEAPSLAPSCGAVELRLGRDSLTLLQPGGAPSLEEALRLLAGADLVLSLLPPAEGAAMVEFCPQGAAPQMLGRAGLLALAGPGEPPSEAGVPGFGGAAALAGFLAARVQGRAARRSLTILADGKPLPAKAFVRDIIANSLHGLLAPLRGTEGARRLEIVIEE